MPGQCQWHLSGVFIVNFEHISHLVLVFLLLTLSRSMPAEMSVLGLSKVTQFWQCLGIFKPFYLSYSITDLTSSLPL